VFLKSIIVERLEECGETLNFEKKTFSPDYKIGNLSFFVGRLPDTTMYVSITGKIVSLGKYFFNNGGCFYWNTSLKQFGITTSLVFSIPSKLALFRRLKSASKKIF